MIGGQAAIWSFTRARSHSCWIATGSRSARVHALVWAMKTPPPNGAWRESAVEALLGVYGHRELVALAEMDALYASESDAVVTQEGPDGL